MVAKQRDMVSLSFLAQLQGGIPSQVVLKEHSLAFMGVDAPIPGVITGVYGMHSKQAALVAAANWSRQRASAKGVRAQIMMIDVNYLVDNYALTREQTRADTLAETGWLHLERVASSFRAELKSTLISWIKKDYGASVATNLDSMALADIFQRYPSYVGVLMKKEKSIRGVVHPVNPKIDPSITLWAASVKYEKARFDAATVRYLPDIQVVI